MKRLLLILAILGVIGGGYAVAQNFSKSIPITFTITAPSPPPPTALIEIYSDAALTQVATNVTLGNIAQGESRDFSLFVKNTGTVDVTVTTSVDGELAGVTYTILSQNPMALGVDRSGEVMFRFAVSSNATTGARTAAAHF